MSIVINRSPIETESTINAAASKKIGSYHMANEPKLYEPARTNNFEFVVTGLGNINRAGVLDNSKILDEDLIMDDIRLSVKSANIPSFSQAPITISRGNTLVKYAGTPEFSTGSITINDYIGLQAREALMAWQALSFNVLTEKVGLASDYKKTCFLQEYTPDYQLIRTWRLIGCWISDLDQGGFDSDSSTVRTISATIQYDRAIIDRDNDIDTADNLS